ncbi:MAG: CTP synthase [Planctomycetota bacterium]
MAKYVFVTGGVVSSLGKGITAASIGCMLKSYGLRVNMLKIDPYLNVDPGTMSPYQHGEVYVTEDGAETDLDLGNYERYLDENMGQENNVTTGAIYDTILKKERRGDFLGGTVQVIPHVVNEIKSRIRRLGPGHDVVITEVGGTTGDIEGLPFLEAIREFRFDVGRENVCYVHVTLVPYIRAAQEMKTKPTQQSVAKLREIGVEPDTIICRTDRPLTKGMKEKISLFCNVPVHAVIEELDVQTSIYEVPGELERLGLGKILLKNLGLKKRKRGRPDGLDKYVETLRNATQTVVIGVAGKYTQLKDAYKSIWDALIHAGVANNVKVDIRYVDVEKPDLKRQLAAVDGILIPGGFGDRGSEGKINTVRFARENEVPFFGLCLGMQVAVVEFARNVCGLKGANSTEFNRRAKHPVIALLPEQRKIKDMGATMRLGAYPCVLRPRTFSSRAYGKRLISERHRHRYELNNKYRRTLEKHGMIIAGEYEQKRLGEIVEIPGHPWFVGTQFHPEFKSRPLRPHPLFREFVKAAKEQSDQ